MEVSMPLNDSDDQYMLGDALVELGKVRYALVAAGGSDEAIAYINEVASAIENAVCDPVNPSPVKSAAEVAIAMIPTPSVDVALDISAAVSRTHGMDLDYARTGLVSIEVSPDAQLEVAERIGARIDDHSGRIAAAARACCYLVYKSSADGVIFPRLAQTCARFGIAPLGDEAMLMDADHPNTVYWRHASDEFLAVVTLVLEHEEIQVERTTAQRYYQESGVPLGIVLDLDDCTPMPAVEGEIADGGYAAPHWVPITFTWNTTNGDT
jgi:hypothetical protein